MSRPWVFGGLLSFVLVMMTLLVALAACIFPPKEDTTGGGASGGAPGMRMMMGSSEGGAGDGGKGAHADATVMGMECDVTTTAGPMLCQEVSACPMLSVNQNYWAGCGFAVAGKGYQLACECMGYICLAPPTPTCAAASLVLEQMTASQVCDALDDGGCSQEFIPLMDSGF
jgi:hypothetical protein